MGFKPTGEQVAICNSTSPRVLVKAFAGVGKTSTLELKANSNVVKSTYLAFNKSIQLEAEQRFPKHVIPKTVHSYAFGRFGYAYANVPNKLKPDIKPFHVRALLSDTLNKIPSPLEALYCNCVLVSLKRFLASADDVISGRHIHIDVPPNHQKYFLKPTLIKDIERVWSSMCDVSSDIPMLHDGYLKLYQLSMPTLPFDCIYFDEVQDTNPVTQAIVANQHHAQIIYVGDEHQAIYGFRGAFNALASLDVDETHHLTASFRFGPQVAEVANLILRQKGELQEVRGLGGQSKVVDYKIKAGQPHAFISRGNASLFRRAAEAVKIKEPYAFVGDVRGYRFDLITDVHNLQYGLNVSDPYIRSFNDYNALVEYAEASDDRELTSRIKLVEEFKDAVPSLVKKIAAGALSSTNDKGLRDDVLVLTTAHKSKGTEFDTVQLASDYKSFFDNETMALVDIRKLSGLDQEEYNLQYVAATRAKKTLHLSESINELVASVN